MQDMLRPRSVMIRFVPIRRSTKTLLRELDKHQNFGRDDFLDN